MRELSNSQGRSYSDIAECLFAEIREGRYSVHNSFPSLTRIMTRVGVTRVTAMRSVDELKRRGVVEASLRSDFKVIKFNNTIGLILPGVRQDKKTAPLRFMRRREG
jgi:DNA-binding FadR family transcriptional regulator